MAGVDDEIASVGLFKWVGAADGPASIDMVTGWPRSFTRSPCSLNLVQRGDARIGVEGGAVEARNGVIGSVTTWSSPPPESEPPDRERFGRSRLVTFSNACWKELYLLPFGGSFPSFEPMSSSLSLSIK
jgi:hypothetical protein